GEEQSGQWHDRDIANTREAPPGSKPGERARQRPTEQSKPNNDEDGREEQEFIDVVENVMAHFMAHDGFDFRQRGAIEQIVIQGDAHGAEKAADVGADAFGLAGGVHLINFIDANAVGTSQTEDGFDDLRFIQGYVFVEERRDEHGGDQDQERQENKHDDGAPDV